MKLNDPFFLQNYQYLVSECLNHINIVLLLKELLHTFYTRSRCGRDCIVVGFTTTYAVGAYHN